MAARRLFRDTFGMMSIFLVSKNKRLSAMDSVVVDECLWWKTAAAIITTIAVNDGCEFVGLSACLRLPQRKRSQPRDRSV